MINEEEYNKSLRRWFIITSLKIPRYFTQFVNSNILNFATSWIKFPLTFKAGLR